MLIGLNGRKQAGKDTVYQRASHILEPLVKVERKSFAALLYQSAAASLGVTVEQLQEWKSDPETTISVRQRKRFTTPDGIHHYTVRRTVVEQTIREYLQHYGTESHRDVFGTDFWTEQVDLSHEGRLVMVTDCRFPNEAEAIRAAGGMVVEIIGPMGRATADTHASEAPLPGDLIDVTITNTTRDDNYRALDAQVDTLLRVVLKATVPA